MGSSIPAATDYLVAQIAKLPMLKPPAYVSDGWPATGSDTLVTIGVVPEGDDIDAGQTTVELGGAEYEDVDLPCLVAVLRGGDLAKTARAAAFEIYDAIGGVVRADRTLGKAIRAGRRAYITGLAVEQTNTAGEAGEGRVCRIRFTISWQHRF